ncbi:MAG TPA: hypothetical protein DCM05_07375 [Elusimicrobia bacterium]|nr:hypothetical protein [Elusimicrobiota bacterium]
MRRSIVLACTLAALAACKPEAQPPVLSAPPSLQAPALVPEPRLSILPTTKLRLPDGEVLFVEVADTPENREIGLMHRKSLPKEYGMLFVFPQEQGLQFWMKNTFVDLDMVWITRDKKVSGVHRDVPKSAAQMSDDEVARRSGLGQYVLELPAGAALRHKVGVGSKLDFEWKAVDR